MANMKLPENLERADDMDVLRVLATHGTPTPHGRCKCWAEAQRALIELHVNGFEIVRPHDGED